MTRQQHLLGLVAEECAEIAQRASKAQRFGLDEVQPGQPLTNAERIMEEYIDLVAVMEMIGHPAFHAGERDSGGIEAKKLRVERWLAYSRQRGTLEG